MPRGVKTSRNTDKKKGREVLMADPGVSLYALVQATLGNGSGSVTWCLSACATFRRKRLI